MALDNDILFHFHHHDWQGEEEIYLELLNCMAGLLEDAKGLAEEDEQNGPRLEDGDVAMPEGITQLLARARSMDLVGITSSHVAGAPIMISAIWYDMLGAVHTTAQLTQMLTDDVIEVLELLPPEEINEKYIP